jgi:acyl dehydratase
MNYKVDEEFKTKFVVSPYIYDNFISLFGDKNPLHTDEQFAVSKGFPGRVMHGNILNGFLSYFVGECLPDKNVIIHSQEINYKNPVFLNDQLELTARVNGIFESVGAIEFFYTFKNQKEKTVAKGKIQIGILK